MLAGSELTGQRVSPPINQPPSLNERFLYITVDKKCILRPVRSQRVAAGEDEMRIRVMALVGLLGVVGTMVNAEQLTNQAAVTTVAADQGGLRAMEDPFPPPPKP